MELRPIRQKRIYEEIVQQFRELIASGDLKPGSRLLPERDLAKKLQVSRASLREALRALDMLGFVEMRQGDGTFVKDEYGDTVIQPLAMYIFLGQGSLSEIYEVRKTLESTTARLAAERATIAELEKINEILKQMGHDQGQSGKERLYDAAFHSAIAEAAHNSLLMRLLYTISNTFNKTMESARKRLYLIPGNAERLLEQHGRIYRAILGRQSWTAQKEMFEHLVFAETQLARNLSSNLDHQGNNDHMCTSE